MCMGRTNILLDDTLVEKGHALTGLPSKRELVHRALEELVRREEQKQILSLEGRIRWEGDLDQMRRSRFSS